MRVSQVTAWPHQWVRISLELLLKPQALPLKLLLPKLPLLLLPKLLLLPLLPLPKLPPLPLPKLLV